MRGFELSNMKLKGVHLRGVPLSGIGTPRGGSAAGLPPEIKAALVAWYSPKRSALNNYNVIESYAEDFMTWSYNSGRGTLTRTSSKLVISAVLQDGLNIIEDINTPFYNIKVRVTGVTPENAMTWRSDLGGASVVITQDGVYTLPSGLRYYGFRFAAIGRVNVTIEQLPTSTLDDLSGNGHTLYLKGYKGKLGSGMGLYAEDFMTWNYVPERGDLTRTPSTLHFTNVKNTVTANIIGANATTNKAMKLRITGSKPDNPLMVGSYSGTGGFTPILSDGIYTFTNNVIYFGFRFEHDGAVNVTVEQIPDYPDQLCHDGTCYGISYGQPLLTDYTVVANRTWFGLGLFAHKGGVGGISSAAFAFEQKGTGSVMKTNSYGAWNNATIANGVSVQTKNTYNGTPIVSGAVVDGSDVLTVGASNFGGAPFNGCYSDFMLFNRTLTPEEIEIVKKFIT